MVYKKEINEMGAYQSADGTRYDILESTKVVSPLGVNVGWDEFKNIYEANKLSKKIDNNSLYYYIINKEE